MRTEEETVRVVGVDVNLCRFLSPSNHLSSQTRSAAEAIVHFAHQYEGQLDIVALGPLSNIAAAMAIDPDLGAKLNSVTVMGGSPTALGNSGQGETQLGLWGEGAVVVTVVGKEGLH